jgi:SHS2 domain-containing protein
MLLHDFLEEILFLQDSENLIFKRVVVDELDEKSNSISAIFYGESFDNKKHLAKAHIKAITYFDMQVIKEKKGFVIKFIADV